MGDDWKRWREIPGGYVLVPPECCPACGWGWPEEGAWRPGEGSMQCTCAGVGADRRHSLWICRICRAYVAEGCVDASRWGYVTTPAGLPDELRWTC